MNEPNDPSAANGADGRQQVNHYDGPVFNKGVSNAQLAWNNETVTQNQQINDGSVAPGYEALAALVTDLLRQLPGAGLDDRDRADAAAAAEEVIAEITGSGSPEPGRVRRAVTTLKGALAPVATGLAAGTAVGAQEWAQSAIRGLTGLV
ncbi:hypothetical protein QFZ56_006472 [Streptomyces achromogenes]|uniref:Uncharacterized protein n=1 Tax=Streptomyces achromogenes TaxID=67255 RepID=A0ABU0QA76_STRAH|nr:hypothetical protein [Streptomyces achromogenes]MDQ0687509.1 hypothetical protein [Streptomyces achromogenes]